MTGKGARNQELPPRVLIAEDDHLVGEMVKGYLEEAGYTVVGEASNGQEAVYLAKSLQPDVVLMDIKMPDMDGIEATQRIQSSSPTPIVVLTAFDTPELVERAGEAGVGAYVVKPPGRREIERAIAIAMARFEDMMDLRRLTDELKTEMVARKQAEEERLHLEKEMQQAQKNESLGVLAGGIAHNFNNILCGILGNAELALQDLQPYTPERDNIIRSIAEIKDCSERAANLVSQMLAYVGRGRYVVEVIDLSTMIRELAQILKASMPKRIRIKYDLSASLPAIEADTMQIRQVVMSLVSNAIEATGDKDGEIQIRTGVMDASRTYLADSYIDRVPEPGRYIYLEVSDTGCGMDEEMLEKIFEPFFTTKFTGRGLGLAAVQGILRELEGAVKVDSEEGRGSTFTALFPLPD